MPPTFTDYNGHHQTLLPVQEINLKTCVLNKPRHKLSAWLIPCHTTGTGILYLPIVTIYQMLCTMWCYVQEGLSEGEYIERLLAHLEQCDVILLGEFYAALTAAGQHEIVKLLREGWKLVHFISVPIIAFTLYYLSDYEYRESNCF